MKLNEVSAVQDHRFIYRCRRLPYTPNKASPAEPFPFGLTGVVPWMDLTG